jgi:hypothetical protein
MPELEVNPDLFFQEIQEAVARVLTADAWFDTVPVLTERLGDLDSIIEIAMGKLGICVVIETPFATCNKPNIPSIQFDDIPVTLTIWEDVVLNGNSPNVNRRGFIGTALVALWLLHQNIPRNPEGIQLTNVLYCASPTMVDLRGLIDREKYPNVQGVQLNFKCSAGFNYTPQATLLDGNNQALLDGMGIKLTTDRPFSRT